MVCVEKKFDTVITNKSDQAALMFYHIFNKNKLSSMTDVFNKKNTLRYKYHTIY